MEAYFIDLKGMKEIEEKDKHAAVDGFKLLVLGRDDWAQVPLMWPDHQEQQVDWIKRLSKRDAEDIQRKDVGGSLAFQPRFERLTENIHYLCIRDFDQEGSERPVRFFIASNLFVMMGWNGQSQVQVQEWAERGVLPNPLELACCMGLRVLRHHQRQLESVEDLMDMVEEELLLSPEPEQLKRIIFLHRRTLELKRSLNAHQSVFERLKNIEKPVYGDLQEELMVEMQRVMTSVFQTHEMIESLRGAYQAAVDNRANQVMKVLTLVATIILPISLLTGFFGMNFDTVPFVHSKNGILAFFGFAAIIVVVVVFLLRRKNWLK